MNPLQYSMAEDWFIASVEQTDLGPPCTSVASPRVPGFDGAISKGSGDARLHQHLSTLLQLRNPLCSSLGSRAGDSYLEQNPAVIGLHLGAPLLRDDRAAGALFSQACICPQATLCTYNWPRLTWRQARPTPRVRQLCETWL